jgi:hypothetical protein
MKAVQPHSDTKRGGQEVAPDAAKTDGLCKGGAVGAGGDNGGIFESLKRGGAELAQHSAKNEGMCK